MNVRRMVNAVFGGLLVLMLAYGFYTQSHKLGIKWFPEKFGDEVCIELKSPAARQLCVQKHWAMEQFKRMAEAGLIIGLPVCNRISGEDYWREERIKEKWGYEPVPESYASECYPTVFPYN